MCKYSPSLSTINPLISEPLGIEKYIIPYVSNSFTEISAVQNFHRSYFIIFDLLSRYDKKNIYINIKYKNNQYIKLDWQKK